MSETPEDRKRIEQYGRSRSEQFEVVLIKTGVDRLDAKTEDFRRLSVVASSPTDAQGDEALAAVIAEGYEVVQAVNPSALTEYEMMARDRESRAAMGSDAERAKRGW